ncbi:hypothetical protein F4677DRAFT_441776 [Hypoxylon crocopeplum]|nr:hypothetical protein F4677DRAFT_441776 [Hypoxylon crocopeplum]
MKLQITASLCGILSMAQAMRVLTQSPSAAGSELVATKFTLRDGRSGIVYRQDIPGPVSPIPGWSGLDSSWTPTNETVSYCDSTQIYTQDNEYIGLGTEEDCTTLRDYVLETEGAFLLPPNGILPGYYTGLIAYNTCVFSAGLDAAAPYDGLWVGNKDIADILTLNLEQYVKGDGAIFTEGYFPCSSPSGSKTIPATWNVW